MCSREGQRIHSVVFRTREDHEWVNVSSEQLFSGRTVVVFSLPGAFTPTCSSSHVPRFNQLAPVFKAQAVDEIVCIEELVLIRDYTDRSLRALAAASTVPQIFINGEHIGGSEELEAWLDGAHAEAA